MKRVGEKSQVELTLIFFQTHESESNSSHDLTSKKKGRVGQIWAKNCWNPVESKFLVNLTWTRLKFGLKTGQIWVFTRLDSNLDSNLNLTQTRFETQGQKKIRVESVTRIRLGTRESKLKFVSPLNYSTLVYNAPC